MFPTHPGPEWHEPYGFPEWADDLGTWPAGAIYRDIQRSFGPPTEVWVLPEIQVDGRVWGHWGGWEDFDKGPYHGPARRGSARDTFGPTEIPDYQVDPRSPVEPPVSEPRQPGERSGPTQMGPEKRDRQGTQWAFEINGRLYK